MRLLFTPPAFKLSSLQSIKDALTFIDGKFCEAGLVPVVSDQLATLQAFQTSYFSDTTTTGYLSLPALKYFFNDSQSSAAPVQIHLEANFYRSSSGAALYCSFGLSLANSTSTSATLFYVNRGTWGSPSGSSDPQPFANPSFIVIKDGFLHITLYPRLSRNGYYSCGGQLTITRSFNDSGTPDARYLNIWGRSYNASNTAINTTYVYCYDLSSKILTYDTNPTWRASETVTSSVNSQLAPWFMLEPDGSIAKQNPYMYHVWRSAVSTLTEYTVSTLQGDKKFIPLEIGGIASFDNSQCVMVYFDNN